MGYKLIVSNDAAPAITRIYCKERQCAGVEAVSAPALFCEGIVGNIVFQRRQRLVKLYLCAVGAAVHPVETAAANVGIAIALTSARDKMAAVFFFMKKSPFLLLMD